MSVDEIGRNLILIGRLKKPLGTLMTIRGKWHYPDARGKDDSLRFAVTHVDGHRLAEPLEFDVAQVEVNTKSGKKAIPPYERQKQLDGAEWTLKAYETGSLLISPPIGPDGKEAVAEQAAYYTRPFTSKIVGVLQP